MSARRQSATAARLSLGSYEQEAVHLSKEYVDMTKPVIEMRNIVKKFGDFTANDGINLVVHKGEIHAIL